MRKTFCDGCGFEITAKNQAGQPNAGRWLGTSIRTERGRICVEVITSSDGVHDQGDFCRHCILDALYALDDRHQNTETPGASPFRATA